MAIEVLGPPLFARSEQGRLQSRVGTIFPERSVLVTLPGIHAWQRAALVEHLNAERAAQGQPSLTPSEEEQECSTSVDLFFEPDHVLIRPDPQHMGLAFQADELLQTVVSKRQIKFMFVFDEKVQLAIKQRGECWRISALPQSRDGMRRLIEESKAAIHEQPVYFYSRVSGTRYLTSHEFAQLKRLDGPTLARQLDEIAHHACCRNRLGNPEVDFFKADPLCFGARDFGGVRFAALPEPELRTKFSELQVRFEAAVEEAFREDDVRLEQWRNEMFAALVSQKDETITEEILHGLSPGFFLQIEWLPGGRFEEGEFIFDSIFDEAEQHPNDAGLQRLCDPKAKGFIFNFIREYGDLEFVNVGCISESLSARPVRNGRRGVYITELKARHEAQPIVRFIRMQKWDVRERLDEGKPLLPAILESDEYTDYILDRRLGCRQLGMNLPSVTLRRISEAYAGTNREFVGQQIWATYFERDYIYGFATDKLPPWKFRHEDYAMRVAWLLGKAAASNLIVGRAYENGDRVVFDDGDEVVVEGPLDLPDALIVTDHSGAFEEYRQPLTAFAKDYAKPVNARLAFVPMGRKFAQAYLAAFAEAFQHVQGDYRKRRRAFDKLFRHCKYDPAGSFAYRWECVLKRLDQTEPAALVEAIRRQITVQTESVDCKS